MKKGIVILILSLAGTTLFAQNIGIGTASPSGKLHIDQTGTSPALRINVNNAAAVSPGVFIVSNAQGGALEAINTAATGTMHGVAGVVSSGNSGVANSGVSGVLGISNAQAGGVFSAGVRGINNSTTEAGFGVIGYHAGNGIGMYGEGRIGVLGIARGNNAYGIVAQTGAVGGVALIAEYNGSGIATAAIISNGRLQVAGTNRFAFKHKVTVQNILTNTTTIDNAICNGDPNAIVVVSHEYRSPDAEYFVNTPVLVRYNANNQRWQIITENSSALPIGALFNVIVVSQ